MSRKIVLIFLIICDITCNGQTKIESQKKLIDNFNRAYASGVEKMWSDSDLASSYNDSCYYFASKINSSYYLGLAHSLKARSLVYFELDSAILYEEKSIKIFKNYPDSLNLFVEYYNIGNLHLMENNYVRGLSYFELVIDIINDNFQSLASRYPDVIELSLAYNHSSLASAKASVEDYQGSIDSYLQSLNIIDKIESKEAKRLKAINFANMANGFLDLNDIEKAKHYAFRGISLKKEMKMINSLSFSYLTMGKIEYNLKNFEKAIRHLEQAKIGFKKDNKSSGIYEADLYRAKCFVLQRKYSQAEALLKKLDTDAVLKVDQLLKVELLKVYSDFYLARLNYDKALEYSKLIIKKQRKILIDRSQNSIVDFLSFHDKQRAYFDGKFKSFQFEQERKKMKLLMNSEAEKKWWVYLFMGVTVFSLSLIIILIYRAYKRKNKMNAELLGLIKQKEVLLKEVHHRVKNNFQITSSLINLQERLESGERIKTVLSVFKGRIKSMSIVHEMLYRSNNVEAIDFSAYVLELLSSIKDSYGQLAENIRIKVLSESIYFKLDKAVPIALILNEGITNSIKHAFDEIDNGQIIIQLKEIGPSQFELLMKDDGVGIPPDILQNTTDKMGLDLINILSEQIDGEVFIGNSNGAEIKIRFKG